MAFERPERAVDRVFLHCSASDAAAHDNVETMRRWHVEDRGWSDVGYHFFIRKNGRREAGRPLERVPAAQAGHNTGSIAICLHGLDVDRFTKAQFDALIELCDEIDAAYGEGGISYHGHCEVSSKACPVFDYREVLGLDTNGERSRPANAQPGSAELRPAPQADPVLRRSASGPEVELLQALLKAAGVDVGVDGLFGQDTEAGVRAFQARERLRVDGVVGPATWLALRAASAPSGRRSSAWRAAPSAATAGPAKKAAGRTAGKGAAAGKKGARRKGASKKKAARKAAPRKKGGRRKAARKAGVRKKGAKK